MAVNEYLLDFLKLVFVDEQYPNSLKKLIGRKKRFSPTLNGKKIPEKDDTGFFRIWYGDQFASIKRKPYNCNDIFFYIVMQ